MEDLDDGKASRSSHGMTGVREVVLVAAGAAEKGLEHRRPDCEPAERRVPAADPLREGQDVRLDVELLDAEPRSETPESGDHLVRDEKDAVSVTDLADSGEVALRRPTPAAAAPTTGSAMKAATLSGPTSMILRSSSAAQASEQDPAARQCPHPL